MIQRIRGWMMHDQHENADLYAALYQAQHDIARLENDNRALSDMSISDNARIARQARQLIELTDDRDELAQALDEAKMEIAELQEQLETSEYMRNVISQCRDDAEQRANGFGKYVAGSV